MVETWHCAFRSTFRLLPRSEQSLQLGVFLSSDGQAPEAILTKLPYASERAETPGELPDPKRYRDGRQLLRTVGLVYEDSDGRLRVTELGRALLRWLPHLTKENAPVLGRHAALALAACQLRNPTGEGKRYANEVVVFPFRTIWQIMLTLGGRIYSDELNRAVFKITREDQVGAAIETIRQARSSGDVSKMGPETVEGSAKNDRILVWMAWASFGWLLIRDKSESTDGSYTVNPKCRQLLYEISRIRHRHRDFSNEIAYVKYLAQCAAIPPDVR